MDGRFVTSRVGGADPGLAERRRQVEKAWTVQQLVPGAHAARALDIIPEERFDELVSRFHADILYTDAARAIFHP